MNGLRKNDSRLLRVVKNKPHATQTDHYDALPTPPATNSTRSSGSHTKIVEEEDEDVMRDPVSSDDEEAHTLPSFGMPSAVDGAQDEQLAKAQWQTLETRSYGTEPEVKKAVLKMPSLPKMRSPESTRSKRSNESDEQGSSDMDNPLWSSQGSTKRVKRSLGNIHGPRRKPKQTYGKQRWSVTSSTKVSKETVAPKQVDERKQAKFTIAEGLNDVLRFTGGQAQAEFTTPDESVDADAANSLSPSLSSLSSVPDSPGVEEIKQFHLPAAIPYCPTLNCDICGLQVNKHMKEDFEDKYTDGKPLNFKWQQRFCHHHKQETAKLSWEEKGYPVIDWAGLEARMRRFDEHLRDVIQSRVGSKWKHDLGRQLRPSTSKFPEVRTAADARDVKTTAWTGYYGPRGERAMTEHIVANLSDDLRKRASKDKTVAAAGVKGGVSGFVHGVLVPELACHLIAEDMGIEPDDARITVGQSVDEGVLLNPDVDEDVTGNGRGRGRSGEDALDE